MSRSAVPTTTDSAPSGTGVTVRVAVRVFSSYVTVTGTRLPDASCAVIAPATVSGARSLSNATCAVSVPLCGDDVTLITWGPGASGCSAVALTALITYESPLRATVSVSSAAAGAGFAAVASASSVAMAVMVRSERGTLSISSARDRPDCGTDGVRTPGALNDCSAPRLPATWA